MPCIFAIELSIANFAAFIYLPTTLNWFSFVCIYEETNQIYVAFLLSTRDSVLETESFLKNRNEGCFKKEKTTIFLQVRFHRCSNTN